MNALITLRIIKSYVIRNIIIQTTSYTQQSKLYTNLKLLQTPTVKSLAQNICIQQKKNNRFLTHM